MSAASSSFVAMPPPPPDSTENEPHHVLNASDRDDSDDSLFFIRSPVDRKATLRLNNASNNSLAARLPVFFKYSSSTTYEMFFDLWFVANLEVYNSSHSTEDGSTLRAYLGYLTMLWMTWFLVGMFDVRFITDSIWERVTRAVHFGVMVGFAVVGPDFDPADQRRPAFVALSLILMVSRLVLVCQYCTLIWHIRRFAEGKWPVAVVAAFHLLAALVYLGISFRFTDDRNSRAYIAWYVVGICEVLLNLVLSKVSSVLSFKGTHLTERLTVLTIIILGEGILSIAKNVSLIVQNAAWTSATIGVLTAAIATVYLFFQVYFDLMRNHGRTRGYRQLFWAVLHFPFHLCLLLFMDGASNFLTVWKLLEVEHFTLEQFLNVGPALAEISDMSTSHVITQLNNTVNYIWSIYPPTYAVSLVEVDNIFADISTIPDEMWLGSLDETLELQYDAQFNTSVLDLMVTVVNSVFVNFKIDPLEKSNSTDPNEAQWEAIEMTESRFSLVFIYAYVCAGLVIMFTAVLYILTKPRGWNLFHAIRAATIFLIGFGLALLSTMSLDVARSEIFSGSPWLLPTLCLSLLVVLIVVHLPSRLGCCCSARRPRGGAKDYPSHAGVHMATTAGLYAVPNQGSHGSHWTAARRKEPVYQVIYDRTTGNNEGQTVPMQDNHTYNSYYGK